MTVYEVTRPGAMVLLTMLEAIMGSEIILVLLMAEVVSVTRAEEPVLDGGYVPMDEEGGIELPDGGGVEAGGLEKEGETPLLVVEAGGFPVGGALVGGVGTVGGLMDMETDTGRLKEGKTLGSEPPGSSTWRLSFMEHGPRVPKHGS
jgi:hypothetical protein